MTLTPEQNQYLLSLIENKTKKLNQKKKHVIRKINSEFTTLCKNYKHVDIDLEQKKKEMISKQTHIFDKALNDLKKIKNNLSEAS